MTKSYRIVEEKTGSQPGWHYVACPVCRRDDASTLLTSKDYLNHVPGDFTLVQCESCQFVYTNPRPFGAELTRFYPDSASYYQPGINAEDACREVTQGKKARRLQRYLGYGERRALTSRLRTRKLLEEGFPYFVKGGRVLEIGCSYGKFLYQLQCLGWSVEGIEPNQTAADYARSRLGLNIKGGSVEDIELQDQSYDAVLMRMSLEHVASPRDTLATICNALKPGGQLIITVPNYSCFEARYFKEFAYFLQLPTHMSHFTPATLRNLLQRTGFTIRHLVSYSTKRDVLESFRIRSAVQGEDRLARLAGKKWFRRLVLGSWFKLTQALGRGCRMTVYAEKR